MIVLAISKIKNHIIECEVRNDEDLEDFPMYIVLSDRCFIQTDYYADRKIICYEEL